MTRWRALSAARRAVGLSAVVLVSALIVTSAVTAVQAQQPKAPAKQPAKQIPRQAEPRAAPQQAAPRAAPSPIVSLPWVKLCDRDPNDPQSRQVCLTLKEALLDTGQFLASGALIEQEGEAKKLFRVMLPLAMQLPAGVRLLVDGAPPVVGRYVTCLPTGCLADVEVDVAFVAKLKTGQQLSLQGISLAGQVATIPLTLANFAQANEGPAMDPKRFADDQQKFRSELERRRLESVPK